MHQCSPVKEISINLFWSVKGVSRVYQGCFRKFLRCTKEVARVFQKCSVLESFLSGFCNHSFQGRRRACFEDILNSQSRSQVEYHLKHTNFSLIFFIERSIYNSVFYINWVRTEYKGWSLQKIVSPTGNIRIKIRKT